MRLTRIGTNKDLSKPSSEEISAQVERFLRTGGRINVVPQGVSGEAEAALRLSKQMATHAKKRAASRAMGITEAARLIGVAHGWLNRQCDLGLGPKFCMSGKRKAFLSSEVLEWWRSRDAE